MCLVRKIRPRMQKDSSTSREFLETARRAVLRDKRTILLSIFFRLEVNMELLQLYEVFSSKRTKEAV